MDFIGYERIHALFLKSGAATKSCSFIEAKKYIYV